MEPRLKETLVGLIDEGELERSVVLEELGPTQFRIVTSFHLGKQEVRREIVELPAIYGVGESEDTVFTTNGLVPRSTVRRDVKLVDGPKDIAVVTQYFDGCELVHRSARVVLKG